ncbi:hypothetical protein L798_00925 [Zootermopsis nevadensis]|uniref:Uncharacterized protein n=1 Tax=Zootermopsis nevadensis TaxID=136037 RepID=A0A067QM52_ZOONE|nr:hypothetical protein L798_00925 [Zootermopsis nevadensis]
MGYFNFNKMEPGLTLATQEKAHSYHFPVVSSWPPNLPNVEPCECVHWG